MIKSMTGFGKSECSYEGKQINVEIRTLNSKQLDLSVRTYSLYKEKESEIRSLVAKSLGRGKIDLNINVETGETNTSATINNAVVKSYMEQLNSIAADFEMPNSSEKYLDIALRLPDSTLQTKEKLDQNEWKEILSSVQDAISKVDAFRVQEGKSLEADLSQRVVQIQGNLEKVRTLEPARTETIKARIHESVVEAVGADNLDANRLEQEIVYYVEKLDISEEMVRLSSHCNYFLENLNSDDSNGKKLGFIGQEIGREINTIGSKANDANIQQIVVEMKDDLEKIKEQVLNVL